MYEGQNTAHTMQLLNTLHTLRMKEGTPVEEFIRRVRETLLELKTIGEEIQDPRLVHLTLSALPLSYEGFIQVVVGQEQLPTFENLCNRLLYEEQQQKSRLDDQGKALMP